MEGAVESLVQLLLGFNLIVEVSQVCLELLICFHRVLEVLLVRRVFTLGFQVFLHLSELFTLSLDLSQLVLNHHQLSTVFLFNIS
jgi:hypothetical protein